jgi:ribonuclease T2
MNQKTIIRLVLGVIVAAISAWQLQGNQTAPGQPTHSGQQNNHHAKGGNHNKGSHSNDGGSNNKSSTTGDFDYYVVSLSWSPAYCVTHPKDQRQCGGKGFGFVLHGVWPQKLAGGYPEDCPPTSNPSNPSNATIQKTLAFMPSEKLISHEWTKHGTCTGLSADEYFSLADRAFSAIKIPLTFQAPETSRNLNSEQILTEFASANPALPADSITLRCAGNELEEVRVCFDTQLKPRACGKGVRTQCGRESVQIRAAR